MRKSMLLSICAWLIAISSFAQTTPITGKVMDNKGALVSRVKVLEKRTKNVIRNGGNTSYQEVFIITVGSIIICLENNLSSLPIIDL